MSFCPALATAMLKELATKHLRRALEEFGEVQGSVDYSFMSGRVTIEKIALHVRAGGDRVGSRPSHGGRS